MRIYVQVSKLGRQQAETSSRKTRWNADQKPRIVMEGWGAQNQYHPKRGRLLTFSHARQNT
eukprot:c2040_g1_i1 orf=2-181(-)